MKKDKHSQKAHHVEQSRRHKLQQQMREVRRRRNVTAGLTVLLLAGLLVVDYYRSVPPWLYLALSLIPLLLVLDTMYLKHLRQQLSKHA